MLLSDPECKEVYINHFRVARNLPIPPGNIGGKGYPDSDMYGFCDWLNEYPGVYTLQSCAGHVGYKNQGEYSGNLWVYLPKRYSKKMRKRATSLVYPPIEYVRLLFRPSGEIWDIGFAGNNCGRLEESLRTLKRVFEEILK